MDTQPEPEQPTQRLFDIEATPFGDSALMLKAAAGTAEERQAGSRRLRELVFELQPHGLLDVVAGVDSVLVEFDCLAVSHGQLAQTIRLAAAGGGATVGGLAAAGSGLAPVGGGLAAAGSGPATAGSGTRTGTGRSPELFEIPVVVSEAFSPDLPGVADELGISQEAVLEILESTELSINLLASAMAPMMGSLPFPGQVSRCREPRTNVDPGSVMVAGTSAIIQPFPGPSGWKVIGRTPLTVCDIREDPATSYTPGDRVRFRVIPESEWDALEGRFLRPTISGGLTDGNR
ncbi:carboxyltransferase domain-containing protein [Arthrobacter sp. NPDC056691]|uniref:carboxyltransferase domain-containing protein n=1 Tax=Arthrobacter sp. NPDC056691 TaxID=3345913 RepID=UPI003672A2F3